MLGLATGSSPTQVYRWLVRWHREGSLSFKNVITFNLVSLRLWKSSLMPLACSMRLNSSCLPQSCTALRALTMPCIQNSFKMCCASQDEYCGLQPDDLQSYHHFMDVHLFDHLKDIDRANIHIPDGTISTAEDTRK